MEIEGDARISAENRAGTPGFRLRPSPLEVTFAEHFIDLDYKDHLSAQAVTLYPNACPRRSEPNLP